MQGPRIVVAEVGPKPEHAHEEERDHAVAEGVGVAAARPGAPRQPEVVLVGQQRIAAATVGGGGGRGGLLLLLLPPAVVEALVGVSAGDAAAAAGRGRGGARGVRVVAHEGGAVVVEHHGDVWLLLLH